jgi:hypothetical protein
MGANKEELAKAQLYYLQSLKITPSFGHVLGPFEVGKGGESVRNGGYERGWMNYFVYVFPIHSYSIAPPCVFYMCSIDTIIYGHILI